MLRAFRLTRTLGQWFLLLGVALAALGFAGWLVSVFHRPSAFLLNLGIMALPAFFLGLVFLFAAAILERFLVRRSSGS